MADFSAEDFLEPLKPFQRLTVERAYERLTDQGLCGRFLVADEVGLGKTMVARGVIARIAEANANAGNRRTTVVYISSNQAIAHQNFVALDLLGGGKGPPVLDRLTTLPLHLSELAQRSRGASVSIDVIPLTPGTSFDFRSGVGRIDERVLIWHLLNITQLHSSSMRRGSKDGLLCRFPAGEKRFEGERERIRDMRIDGRLARRFKSLVKGARFGDDGWSVSEEIEDLKRALGSASDEAMKADPAIRRRRSKLIGVLRRTLAEACIEKLRPDLVVVDEFQRFTELLNPEDSAGALADLMFSSCKSLMLSATPYRMGAHHAGLSQEQYREFLEICQFLLARDIGRLRKLEEAMEEFRRQLLEMEDHPNAVISARDTASELLGQIMCRTERMDSHTDGSGMIDERPFARITPKLRARDLRAFKELDGIARRANTYDVVELWKSTPYPLNMMEGYVVSDRFEEMARGRDPQAIRTGLDASRVREYQQVDAGNARLRGFLEQIDNEGSWQLLWLPPSLPYYRSSSPFAGRSTTKKLVFSGWRVVPKSLSAMVSYHVDRRIQAHAGTRLKNSSAGRRAVSQPLQWGSSKTYTELLISAPLDGLSKITDPLSFALQGHRDDLLSQAELRALASKKVREAVKRLALPVRGGREDRRWYLIAAIRLDQLGGSKTTSQPVWLTDQSISKSSRNKAWREHVATVGAYLGDDSRLGRVPSDLVDVLTRVGLFGPGCCAFRALGRSRGTEASALEAMKVSDALRTMFNLPEAVLLVRSFDRKQNSDGGRTRPYWRAVLKYCAAGNLQAVLDEYAHVLGKWVDPNASTNSAASTANVMADAIGLQAASLSARSIDKDGRIPAGKEAGAIKFRSRYCLRLEQSRTEDEQSVHRIDGIRQAFNSPFWPFVLATTSIGQEGLDFHLYAHAVVHWNLPHSPVELEQREGRVHRFKNHAVRRNIAKAVGLQSVDDVIADPWEKVFQAAIDMDDTKGVAGDLGLSPHWIFDGPHQIERHVLAEPMSREAAREKELVRLLGIYRLAFGQPRQNEMVAALGRSDIDSETIRKVSLKLSPSP